MSILTSISDFFRGIFHMTPNLSGLTLLLGNTVTGGVQVTGEVTLSGNATSSQPVTFNLDPTSGGTKIATVYVPKGQKSTTFNVTFNKVTASKTVTIWANSGSGNGVTLSYPVTVTPGVTPPPPSVTLSSLNVNLASVATGASLSVTANLTGAAPSGDAIVTLSASPAIAGLPSITIPAGATSATVTITAPSVTVNTTYVLMGTYSTSAHVSFVVTAAVTPPPPPPTPPVISITAPAAGATISGTITAAANASDAQGITSVQWELDGSTSLGIDTSAPYTESIDTTKIANGSHTLTAIAKDVSGLTTASSGVAVTVNNAIVPPPPPPSGSLASGLGTPTFQDLFNYTSVSGAFSSVWQISTYLGSNYAGAGSNVQFAASNISFPIGPNGVPVLCLKLSQSSASASSGAEILTNKTFGYGTYEFYSRMGSSSATPSGAGSSVSGGVSSTFLISNNNGGSAGYVEIDAPECEGDHATWAEYDVWFNGNGSGNNHQPSGPGFKSQGAGADTYLDVPNMVTGYNYYGFVWSVGRLDFYLNGVLQGSLTGSGVPVPGTGGNTPAIDINHYGTNGSGWGGSATVGSTRYFYVQSAKFWAA
jgi:Bacterial Ig domain/Glycosyl hydrolases family 16